MRSGPHSIGSHPARPQSGVADGARARNRPARWHDSLRIRQPKGQVPRLNPQAVIPNPPFAHRIANSDRTRASTQPEWDSHTSDRAPAPHG